MRRSSLCQSVAVAAAHLVAWNAAAQDAPPRINFEEHIRPIMTESCTSCHNQRRARNGFAADSYDAIMQGGSSGASIVKGDPGRSLFFQLIAHAREPFMPYEDAKLPADQIEMIRQWIALGAPRTRDDAVMDVVPGPRALDPAALTTPGARAVMPEGVRTEPWWWTEQPPTVNALAASPTAPLIAVAGHRQVVLYHGQTLARLGVLDFPEGMIHLLRFSRDGGLLLAGGGRGGESGRVVAWDAATGERVLELGDEPDVVLAADISDDRTLVALGGPDRVVRVYNTSDGSLAYDLRKHTDWVTALEFSPDGVLLVTGDRAGNALVWEARTGREYQALPSHNGRVTDVTWRADSVLFATAGEDGVIRVLDAEGCREQRAFNASGGVLSIEWDRTGRIATAGRDRLARLFGEGGNELRTFGPLNDLATSVCVTHDGSRVVVGGWDGDVRAFEAADGTLAGAMPANPPTSWQEAVTAAAREYEALAAGRAALAAAATEAEQSMKAALAEADAAESKSDEAAAALASQSQHEESARAALVAAEAREAALARLIVEREASVQRAKEAIVEAEQADDAARQGLREAIERHAAVELALERAADDAQRSALAAELATARALLDGAVAIAERESAELAKRRLALATAEQQLAARITLTTDERTVLQRTITDARAVLDEVQRLRAAAQEASAIAAERRRIAQRMEAAHTDAVARLTAHDEAIASASRRRDEAAAAWQTRREAIMARAGRVE